MNKKEIIQEVKKRINPEDIKFLFWFGTRPGRDIDLLIVLKRETEVRLCESSKPKLDILMIDNSEFIRRLSLFDPAVTEPLITGSVLLGNKEEIGLLRSDTILSLSGLKRVPKETIRFLKERACKRLKAADAFLQKGNSALYSFLVELSWACGYYVFAEYYNNTSTWITFDHLLAVHEDVVFKQVMSALEVVKSGGSINRSCLIDLFQETQKMLRVAL